MTIFRAIAPIVVLALGVFAFVVLSRGKEVESREEGEKQPPLVETKTATLHDDGLDIDVDGTVVPFRDVVVSAEVAGRVIRKHPACETGEYVRQGTLLFEIDPQDYILEVKRLKNQQAQAENELAESNVQIENTEEQIALSRENLELQRKELARSQGLFKKGVITEADFEGAQRTELMAREALLSHTNQLRVFKSRVDRLEAAKALVDVQLERANLDLKRTKVTSPIDGVVIAESVEEDGFVQKGAMLITIQDTATMEVKCNLRVEDIYWVLQQTSPESQTEPLINEADAALDKQRQAFKIPATAATVVFEHVFAWDGTLERLDGVGLDAKTRLVPCRVVVRKPLAVKYIGPAEAANQPTGPSSLLRNMYVQVKIHTKPRTKLIRVPDEAIRPGDIVYVVRDGKLAIVAVSIVKRWKEGVLIDGSKSKLQAGDKVVVSPVAAVRPEMSVREKNE